MKPRTAILCILLLPLCSYAQADSSHADTIPQKFRVYYNQKSLALLAGCNYYWRSGGELGIGMVNKTRTGYHPFSSGAYLSCEFYNDKTWFAGPKAGVWASGGISALTMGLSAIYYTGRKNSSLQLRPEIGLAWPAFVVFTAETSA